MCTHNVMERQPTNSTNPKYYTSRGKKRERTKKILTIKHKAVKEKKKHVKQEMQDKIADIKSNIVVIIINVNDLNSLVKSWKSLEDVIYVYVCMDVRMYVRMHI